MDAIYDGVQLVEKGDCRIVLVPVMDAPELACIKSLSTINNTICIKCNTIKHASHRKGHAFHI